MIELWFFACFIWLPVGTVAAIAFGLMVVWWRKKGAIIGALLVSYGGMSLLSIKPVIETSDPVVVFFIFNGPTIVLVSLAGIGEVLFQRSRRNLERL